MKRPKPEGWWIEQQAARMRYLLQQRASVPREDLEYLVEKVAGMRDTRLQQCVAELIGWGDEDRAEIETFVAIAIEVMKRTTASTLRSCARTVELRYLSAQLAHDKPRTHNIAANPAPDAGAD